MFFKPAFLIKGIVSTSALYLYGSGSTYCVRFVLFYTYMKIVIKYLQGVPFQYET